MNERIKELAGEALDKAVPYTWHNLDHVEVEKVMKEFAELIVQDINNTILHTARWHQEVEKDDTTVIALCDLVKDIREEYGVQ